MIKAAALMLYTGLFLAQQKLPAMGIKWRVVAKMPAGSGQSKATGQAGVFAGISQNVMLVAGGSNFPHLKPWEGGKKVQSDKIFVLKKDNKNSYRITRSEKVLPHKTACGASASTPYGIVCTGGETPDHSSIRTAFLMNWNEQNKHITFTDLPQLPIPLANAAIAVIGNNVYLFGGESEGKPSARAFVLNLQTRLNWQPINNVPVAMSHSVAVTQSNGKHICIYLIGGRSATRSGISDLHNTTFCYDPELDKWTKCADVSDGNVITHISAGVGVAHGKNLIYYIGGDKGNVFHQIETYNNLIASAKDDDQKEKLQSEKLKLIVNHKGFSRDVLVYNALTNTWKKAGELNYTSHVTTTAVMWDGKVFIPGGEIKPGTRTPDIVAGTFEPKRHL